MNSTAERLHNHSVNAIVFGWPHKGHKMPFSESEVQEKVTSILADEIGISSDELAPDTSIKEDLRADANRLNRPIMMIENYFRTFLQEEVAHDQLSVGTIVDKIMGDPMSCNASRRPAPAR